jgi:hypothetical protein
MGNSKYYLALTVATLSVGIYNFASSSEGAKLQCFSISSMTYQEYKAYNDSIANATTKVPILPANITLDAGENSVYDVPMAGSNIINMLQIVIAFAYIAVCGLSILLAAVIWWMENMVPDDFLNISKCKKACAILCKVIPPFLIFAHYIILIVIIIVWIMIVTGGCVMSVSNVPGIVVNKDKYSTDSKVLNIVTTCIWFLIHYGGAIVRDVVYQEPFMYSPVIGDQSVVKVIFLKKLGP